MSLSYRIAYVFLRNLYSYKRFVVPTFLVSLVEPLFYLVTFGIGMGAYMGQFGGRSYLFFLVPGVIITSVMMSATFECLYGTFVKMIHEHLYDSLIATPVSAEDAVAGAHQQLRLRRQQRFGELSRLAPVPPASRPASPLPVLC